MKEKDDFKKNISDKPWWQPAIYTFMKLSGWIAFPILIGVFIGKWLDKKFNSDPWLFLLSVGIAFIISMLGLVKNTLKEYKKIADEENSKKNNKKDE
jgi:F0F1-type ATP synthase assembly protein I